MSIWRHSEWLGAPPEAARISLGEGDTPLVRSRRIGPEAGLPNLYFKLESANPSGSYKDRFAAAAISHMLADGKTRCLATSSGNTGAALAACCAAARIRCRIAVVESAPAAKLQQMLAHGAEVFRVRGFGADPEVTARVFAALKQLGDHPMCQLQISAYAHSPAGMRGVESLGHELAERLPTGIQHVFCPAGGGGLTLAVARGFAARIASGSTLHGPAVHCVQPTGNDTIAGPLRHGLDTARAVNCSTRISGLQVASVIDGNEVIRECRATGGTGHLVRDEQTWEAQRRLAREEGIFSEPAGAVALAGALQAAREGIVQASDVVVCLVTGSGFKDADSVAQMNARTECPLISCEELERARP